ncbi:MAG: peptide chain release factor 3, partial [Dehalococcoidales bacterium]|nr:peptide chain release factor 3 [Dehalococcoidales bacterium]
LKYAEIPRFPPEHFAVLHNKVFSRYKQFNKGLQQLEEEGAIQVLYSQSTQRREPVLAAVGVLQFDVVLSRLEQEYGVEARKEVLPFSCARWVEGEKEAIDKVFGLRSHDRQFRDLQGRMVLLFSSSWEVDYCQKENPGVTFREMV